MSTKLDAQVSVKMPKALLGGLQRIKEKHQIEPAALLRQLGEQAVAFFDQNGYFTFPVEIAPEIPRRTRKKTPQESRAKREAHRAKRFVQIAKKRYPDDAERIFKAMAEEEAARAV